MKWLYNNFFIWGFMKIPERVLNASACINNYTPASISGLVRNNKAFQEKDTETEEQYERVYH